MNERALRRTVVALLRGKEAHLDLEAALGGLEPALRARRPVSGAHSVWDLIEHMRIAQEDILRYTLDPAWRSPPWPEGYWPDPASAPSEERWRATLEAFKRDLEALVALAEDDGLDLSAELPHGEGRTLLRQLLLAADHNSYHLGQLVSARRALGAWPR